MAIDLKLNSVIVNGERYIASSAGRTKVGAEVLLEDGTHATVLVKRGKLLGLGVEFTFRLDDGSLRTRSYASGELIAWG